MKRQRKSNRLCKVALFVVLLLMMFISTEESVYADDTPGNFYITSPEDGEEIDDDFKVKWTSAEGASYYTISIKNLNTGDYVTELKKVTKTSYSVDYDDLESGCEYRIGLVAYGMYGSKKNGGTVNFYVNENKPGEFEITSPDDGDTISGDFKVKWSESERASYYTISIKNIDTGKYVTELEKVTSRTYSVDFDDLQAGCTYRVGLVSYSKSDVKRNGGTIDIYVEESKPGEFYITSPENGDTYEAGDSVTIKWSESTNAKYYTVSVRDLTTNTLIIDKAKVTNSRSYTLLSSELTAGHKYKIAVISYNGQTIRSGGECDITIGEAATPILTNLSVPANLYIGDTFQLSGKILADGGVLQKVYINAYLKSDINNNYKLCDKDNLNVTSFDLSSIGSYVVGRDIFTEPGVYKLYISAMNVGGTSGSEKNKLHEMEITVEEKELIGSFEIMSPKEGAVVSANENLIITWSDAENVHHYKYAVSDKTNSPYVYIEGPADVTTGENSVTISADKLEPGHIYWIHVTAYDAAESTETAVKNSITISTSEMESTGDVTDFVNRLYTEVLEREPDTTGLTEWSGYLLDGTFTGAEVAKGFIMSEEFLNKEMTNEEFVQIMYQAFFGREADANGLATWVDFLDQGYRKSYIFAGFANSTEFGALCDDYGVAVGSVPVTVSEQQPNLSEEEYNVWLFVERMYTEVLERTPDMGGISEWAGYLQNGTFTGAEVASGFILSEEFQAKEITNEEYVQILYQAFFGREADQSGLETWTDALENGYTKKYIFASFANSGEFDVLCESYGIVRGEIEYTEDNEDDDFEDDEDNDTDTDAGDDDEITDDDSTKFQLITNGEEIAENEEIDGKSMINALFSNVPNAVEYKYALWNVTNEKWFVKSTVLNNIDDDVTIASNLLYPGNEYTFYFSAYDCNKNQIYKGELHFEISLDYTNVGSGKFSAAMTSSQNYILTLEERRNEYTGSDKQEYIKTLAGNIEYIIARGQNALTKEQINCLRDIYVTQFTEENKLTNADLARYIEFRYEGVGKGEGNVTANSNGGHADTVNKNVNAHRNNMRYGLFGAMTVVVKNAEVYGVFFRTSTLPDNYLDYPYDDVATGVVSAGVYNLYRHNHDGFAAFQLRDSDATLPAVYDEVTYAGNNTVTGINIHHNYGSADKRYSAGCLTIHRQDWSEYMSVYGWKIDESNESDYKKAWSSSLYGSLVGKLVLERCIDIKITVGGETYSQIATFECN